MPDTFEALRPALETYLRERGLDPRKRFRCLNPDHYDHDPSMGYDPKRHKVHCFACGADWAARAKSPGAAQAAPMDKSARPAASVPPAAVSADLKE